jgi:hypothetical protein
MTSRATQLLALCALVLAAGCGDTIHGVKYAEPVVAQFRALMKQRDFDKVYDFTGEQFRAATPRKDGVALFEAVDRKLGAVKSSNEVNWGVNTNNGTTLVTLIYATKYEQGDATETFTIEVDGGKGSLVGYNINSLAMMVR